MGGASCSGSSIVRTIRFLKPQFRSGVWRNSVVSCGAGGRVNPRFIASPITPIMVNRRLGAVDETIGCGNPSRICLPIGSSPGKYVCARVRLIRAKRKRYDAEIDVNGGELGKAAGMKANDKSTAGVGEHATDCSSEQSHSQIFNRKLPKEFSLGVAD